jgi:predicted ATPase
MQIAKRVYSLARNENDSALMIGAYDALASTLLLQGDFASARHYAMRGIEIWRSGGARSQVEELDPPASICLCVEALCAWHFGEISSGQTTMAEAMSLAKELYDSYAFAQTLHFAGLLGHFEHNPGEVERLASDLIELATRQDFAFWLAAGTILRDWARSASGNTTEGITWIEDGIGNYRATGSMLAVPYWLVLKAEALHLADRTSEALEALRTAERLAERSGERLWSAELYRLRGVLLAAMGVDETQIEASFCQAIRTAKQQKSTSLATRAKATRAEYRRQKARASGGTDSDYLFVNSFALRDP